MSFYASVSFLLMSRCCGRVEYKQNMNRPGGEILMLCADVVLFLFLGGGRRNE